LLRRFPQAIAAQAVFAIERHREAKAFVCAPAGSGEGAGEFGAAARAGEAARGLISWLAFHAFKRISKRSVRRLSFADNSANEL